jgi:adenine C2-methylase RlmN of 23S rRNA A2503 and tRNA A37
LKNLTRDIPCKINLIPYNSIANLQGYAVRILHDSASRLSSSGDFERIEAFLSRVREGRNAVTLRWSKGDDIDAACGQLWTKVEKISDIS